MYLVKKYKMQKTIIIVTLLFFISCDTSTKKKLYSSKNNPIVQSNVEYDTIYVQEENGDLQMRITEKSKNKVIPKKTRQASKRSGLDTIYVEDEKGGLEMRIIER